MQRGKNVVKVWGTVAKSTEFSLLIYRPRRDGRLSWAWVAGWLHTEISVRHRELNPDTATHLSTNPARRRLTSLIEANALTTTPDHHPTVVVVVVVVGLVVVVLVDWLIE